MAENKQLIVSAENSGQRLDVFLSVALDITRSQAQKMIVEERVKIGNSFPNKMGEKIKTDDHISVQATIENKIKTTNEIKRTRKLFTIKDVKIINATPNYLVVEKPSGMLTHSTTKEEPDSLANILLKKYPKLAGVGEDPVRPGIVHRLDKEASGLLVVARTQKMFNHLKNQFKNRTVIKEYMALAHGKIAKDWDEIKFPIARAENSDRMAALPSTHRGEKQGDGKEALTEFLVEKRFVNFTYLKVKIHTGRMHQIRVHLLAYNHPLVGDPLYLHHKRKPVYDEKLGRLFLHCTHLEFTDLKNNTISADSPLPEKLKSFLTEIK